MKSYSLDLRERVVAAYSSGVDSMQEVADTFGVSLAWIKKMLHLQRTTGSLKPLPHGGGRPLALRADQQQHLLDQVRQTPDATLPELKKRLRFSVSTVTIWRALARAGITFKKNPSVPRNNNARMSSNNGKRSARNSRPWTGVSCASWTKPEPTPA